MIDVAHAASLRRVITRNRIQGDVITQAGGVRYVRIDASQRRALTFRVRYVSAEQ